MRLSVTIASNYQSELGPISPVYHNHLNKSLLEILNVFCFILQHPYTYEETPLNLSECKAETSNDYSKKRTILKLKTENGPDYLLQTESEFSMQTWLQIIDDITANNSRQLRWARRSITSRTRSPTSQSPVNKMRKASAGSYLKHWPSLGRGGGSNWGH